MNVEDKLEGRVAMITGGGTGIGRGVAQALAARGAQVVICGRREEPLQEVIRRITAAGGSGRAVHCDVAQESEVAGLVETTMHAYGRIDILVNNAGVSGGGPIHAHDIAAWDRMMAINLRAPFLLARAVLPIMRRQRSGHIFNISSESGLEYYAGNGAYGVSKHALNALGEYIQRENQEYGVKVSTICPGMVVTEMTSGAAGLDESKCLYPDDIAELVVWLVSRRANLKIGRPVLIQTMMNPWLSD